VGRNRAACGEVVAHVEGRRCQRGGCSGGQESTKGREAPRRVVSLAEGGAQPGRTIAAGSARHERREGRGRHGAKGLGEGHRAVPWGGGPPWRSAAGDEGRCGEERRRGVGRRRWVGLRFWHPNGANRKKAKSWAPTSIYMSQFVGAGEHHPSLQIDL
jgi:hypothetical protein